MAQQSSRFNRGEFPPIPDTGRERVLELLESGALYRYCGTSPEESEVALLERDFASYVGSRYALAINSCGSGLYIAMLCAGVKPGDKVLSSAFTYTAVPSAIVHAGAHPVLVECTSNFCIDLDDLRRKMTPDVKVFLISHMRGHVSDMEEITALCGERGVVLIEDCAHSVGARFNGKHTGRFGAAACYSCQSHKMFNAGEGGLLVTDDEEIIAKAILYAGSQETFWKRHFCDSRYLAEHQEHVPNISMRMSNLAAAIVRSQLPYVDEWVQVYQTKHRAVVERLASSPHLVVPAEDPRVSRGPDTLQFSLPGFTREQIQAFLGHLGARGINAKLFGAPGNPRLFKSWKYIQGIEKVQLPQTERVLSTAFDTRLPLQLTMEGALALAGELSEAATRVAGAR